MTRIAIAVVPLSLALAATAFAASPVTTQPQQSRRVSPATVQAATAIRAADLRAAQRMLGKDGDYKGRVDGKGGPKTIAAIEMYQKKNGLDQTGWLDEKTWNGLRHQYGSTATSEAAHKSM